MAEEYSKNQLAYRRTKGVNKAWEHERDLVRQGRGSRQWSVKEQKEILKTGRCKGYQGHHMVSVKNHPEQADNPKNIQFLCSKKENNEHLKAHKGDYQNQTEWRYNPKSNTYRPVDPNNPRAQHSYELKDKAIEKRGYTKYATDKKHSDSPKTPAQQYASDQKAQEAKPQGKSPASKSVSDNKKSYKRTDEKPSRGEKNTNAHQQNQKSGQRR